MTKKDFHPDAQSGTQDTLQELLRTLFPAHPWHGIPTYAQDASVVNVFVEIVPTDTVKYELDKHTGHLCVDRPQRFSSMCPTLYGFVPRTYCGHTIADRCSERTGLRNIAGDHDPLDICVLSEKTIPHGNVVVRARPIGGFRMIDGGEADDKIIAVLDNDIHYGHIQDLHDLPSGEIDRLQHYFLSYKQRPGDTARKVHIAEVYDRQEAQEVIRCSAADYLDTFGSHDARFERLATLLHEAVRHQATPK